MATTGSPQEQVYIRNQVLSRLLSTVPNVDRNVFGIGSRAALPAVMATRAAADYMKSLRARPSLEKREHVLDFANYVKEDERETYQQWVAKTLPDIGEKGPWHKPAHISPMHSRTPTPVALSPIEMSPSIHGREAGSGHASEGDLVTPSLLFAQNKEMKHAEHIGKTEPPHKTKRMKSSMNLGAKHGTDIDISPGGGTHPVGQIGINEAPRRVWAASNAASAAMIARHSPFAPVPYMQTPFNAGSRIDPGTSSLEYGEPAHHRYPVPRHDVMTSYESRARVVAGERKLAEANADHPLLGQRTMTGAPISLRARVAAAERRLTESNMNQHVSSSETQRLKNQLAAIEQSAKYKEPGWEVPSKKRKRKGKAKGGKKGKLAPGDKIEKAAKKARK